MIAAIDRARRRGPGPKRKKPSVEEKAIENRPASAPGRRRKRRVYEVTPPNLPPKSHHFCYTASGSMTPNPLYPNPTKRLLELPMPFRRDVGPKGLDTEYDM